MTRDHPRPDKIALLLADVDGTLVTHDKTLTDRARRAIEALAHHGIRFALTSGRPPKGMAMLIGPLAIDTPIAGFNGGLFVKPDMTIITARTLPRPVAEATIALLQRHKLDMWVYSGEDWLIHNAQAPHVEREQWTVKFLPKTVKDFGPALDHAVKIVGISDDADLMARVEAEAQAELGDRASAARSQPYYLDVTHKDANKGGVVDYLSHALGIPAAQIATIGDQPNDTLMFRKSGLAIAMGQSSAAVQAEADCVTTSSEEEGFAHAVERFILNEAGA